MSASPLWRAQALLLNNKQVSINLSRDKHSSLFRQKVSDGTKNIYNFETSMEALEKLFRCVEHQTNKQSGLNLIKHFTQQLITRRSELFCINLFK